ncbi:hypothetical protein MMOR_17290 [Mycolicibacterium moriokaense]|uniref:Uncharacterized protein n=1 Tax=Mycolicibacterium moriokaense TaxID=39691 RepID=A0AAD1H8G6_9MYCO|nr:hypothetical protein MMOR_17290 [Mycolicibacterium moriokaense]
MDDRKADDEGDEEEDPRGVGRQSTHSEPLRKQQGGEEEDCDEDREDEAHDVVDHRPSTHF